MPERLQSAELPMRVARVVVASADMEGVEQFQEYVGGLRDRKLLRRHLRGRGAHGHHGRVVPQEARSGEGLISIRMPRDRADGDAAGRDGAVVRDVIVDARECDRASVYRETQHSVQRDSRDECWREDSRESASRGRERGGSCSVAHREDDIELVEGGGIRSISRGL